MKTAKGKRDKGSDHGGLDAWFSGHGQGKSKAKGKAPYGDWIAITPVKKTVTKDDGSKKTYEPGDIVGPCGISKEPEWKGITNNGKDPLKCMPRQKAHDLDKSERAELAKNKKKQESKKPNTGKPVNTPTFGEKANKIKKKALEQIEELEKSASKCSGGKCSRCWTGYEAVPGKKPFSKGSCRKKKSKRMILASEILTTLIAALTIPIKESLGIPRRNMPQVKKKHFDDFMDWLDDEGIRTKEDKIPAKDLKPSQVDFDKSKIKKIMNKEKKLKKEILVSKDNYILDGHHHWLANLNIDKNKEVRVIRVMLPVQEILNRLRSFSKVHYEDVDGNIYEDINPKLHH